MSMGACLVANDPKGIGNAILELRAQGKSWTEIGQELNLGSPSAARKAFTKYTGITDYKTKGPAIKSVQPGPALKSADKAVKQAVKNVDDAAPGANWYGGGDTPDLTFLKMDTPDLGKQALIDKTGLKQTQIDQIIEMQKKGQGYTAIKNATGADFDKIDEVVWDQLLKKHDDKVWLAYKEKPTSISGFNAVKEKVFNLRAKGLSIDEIANMPNSPPKSVVHAILEDKWTMPPMGATQPIIPPPPPATYKAGEQISGSFKGNNWKSNEEMLAWINSLGPDLSSAQVSAIKKYTGSGYYEINTYLRTGSVPYGGSAPTRTVSALDKSMREMPFDVTVIRNMSLQGLQGQDPTTLVGAVFSDKGFVSTTIKQSGVFGGDVQLVIDVPKGARARYVQNISQHKAEQELLLARDTKIQVTEVEVIQNTYGGTSYRIKGRVVV